MNRYAAHSPALLASVLQSGRPTVVAGCLKRDDENLRVLQAFGQLRAAHPAALLVLDTMGDLGDFYAAATVAHVGVDHNVLEALAAHWLA